MNEENNCSIIEQIDSTYFWNEIRIRMSLENHIPEHN